MFQRAIASGLLLVLLSLTPKLSAQPTFLMGPDPTWVSLTDPLQSPVDMAFDQGAAILGVRVRVTQPDDTARINLQLGLAGTSHVLLTDDDATVKQSGHHLIYHFQIPTTKLITDANDWSHFAFGLQVSITTTGTNARTHTTRYHHADHRARFTPMSTNPTDWATFDIKAYQKAIDQQHSLITIDFEQPTDGKASILIEDANGNPVRNLVSGYDFKAGSQRVLWDGLDHNGKLVRPGTYHWRGITHAGIKAHYLMRFANGDDNTWHSWGPNHSTFEEATTNGKNIFLAAPITEGGESLVKLDTDGKFLQGYRHMHGLGIQRSLIAADDQYLYVVQDGRAWGQKTEKGDWAFDQVVSLVRYDIDSGKPVNFPNASGDVGHNNRYITVDTVNIGPASKNPDFKGLNLIGTALIGDKLYIATRHKQAIFIHDTKTGKQLGSINLPGVGRLAAAPDGKLIAVVDDNKLVTIDRDQNVKALTTLPNVQVQNITVGPDRRIYISDQLSHQVRVLTANGQLVKRIGHPGGKYKGKFDIQRMVNPNGLTVAPDGKLWVVESRWNPKRVLAWDSKLQKVAIEKFGSPKYGGPGTGFDPQQHTHIIADQCLWEVDPQTKTSRLLSIFQEDPGMIDGRIRTPLYFRHFRVNGRTFLIGSSKASFVCELLDDGTLKDVAALSSTTMFAYACHWTPPQSYVDAYYKQFPQIKPRNADEPLVGRNSPINTRDLGGVLWVDRNGDGQTQEDEYSFYPQAEKLSMGYWGTASRNLTLHAFVQQDNRWQILRITPNGFDAKGTPNYPTLGQAIEQGLTPIAANMRGFQSAIIDRFDRVIINSDPDMLGIAPDGSKLWQMDNPWLGVHGSHKAPLPEVGVMQGNLYFLGAAALDNKSDLLMTNSNHGRFFLMTSDGVYVDELFRDVRQSRVFDNQTIGGEPFGGYFGKAEDNGKYYLHAGNYRLYEIQHVDTIQRIAGSMDVTVEKLKVAAQRQREKMQQEKQDNLATVAWMAKPPKIDGMDREWSKEQISWDNAGQYKTEIKLGFDAENLYVHAAIRSDISPWINGGKDWTNLFKTGDSLNIELALDPQADPKRRTSAKGDVRLLIAPMDGKNIAVLYRYKADSKENAVEFASPWRSVIVDSCTQLDEVQIAVRNENSRYQLELAIPFKTLGIKAPIGQTIRGDFGINYGDAQGQVTRLRSYWSNKATALVNDVPGEIMQHPDMWSSIRFEERP